MPQPIKIIQLIADLHPGGAESMLARLVSGLDRTRFDCSVVSLTPGGSVGRELAAAGFAVSNLGMRTGFPDPRGLIRFHRYITRLKPDLIQTWMYHADLLGGIAGHMLSGLPVVWGVHHSDFDPRTDKHVTRLTVRACALLAGHVPTRIVCCSESARQAHIQIGYPPERMLIIHSGIDTDEFKPDTAARAELHRELGLPEDRILLGMSARFHPQKDHRGMVEAMRLLVHRRRQAHLVLWGAGVDASNRELVGWIQAAGLADRVSLLGFRDGLPRLLAGLDVACLGSSHGEAFPQAVVEAMATGVPCVVTDVGDSASIVGDTGITVPARDSQALAQGLEALIDEGAEARRRRGLRARRRVLGQFGLARMLSAYGELYSRVAEARGIGDRPAS